MATNRLAKTSRELTDAVQRERPGAAIAIVMRRGDTTVQSPAGAADVVRPYRQHMWLRPVAVATPRDEVRQLIAHHLRLHSIHGPDGVAPFMSRVRAEDLAVRLLDLLPSASAYVLHTEGLRPVFADYRRPGQRRRQVEDIPPRPAMTVVLLDTDYAIVVTIDDFAF